MSFLARLVSDNSRSLENWGWGQPPLSKQFLHGVRVLVRGYLRVRFDLSSSINFRDISGFLKLGAHTLIKGSPQRVQSGTIGFYEYDFLLVINCSRGQSHRFRDIAFDISNVAILGYPSCVLPQSEGFPSDDLRKISHGGQRMATLENGVETLPKILTG